MSKADPKTLAMMPRHVRERMEAIDSTVALQGGGDPPAPVLDVAPTTINISKQPVAPSKPAPVAVTVVPAPAAPTKVATHGEIDNLFGSGEAHEPAAVTAAPTPDPELVKLREEVARLTAASTAPTKPTGFQFGAEGRAKYVALLGEEGTALLESDMGRLAPAERKDVLTHDDLAKHNTKLAEKQFFSDLPKDFYRHASSTDTEFMKWAATTKDGRRSVKDEIGAIVKTRDASGLTYIAEKLEAWQASRKAPAPGTHIGAPAPGTAPPLDKAASTAEEQAAVRAAIRRGDLKGAGEKLSQFE